MKKALNTFSMTHKIYSNKESHMLLDIWFQKLSKQLHDKIGEQLVAGKKVEVLLETTIRLKDDNDNTI